MADRVCFTVLGEPRGKGRPRFARKTGRAYTPERTAAYESLIAMEYRRQVGAAPVLDGCVALRVDAYFGIPKSGTKARRERMERGELRPVKRPDADNILKAVADALNGVAYRDDAQIVACSLEKRYSSTPRLEVTVYGGV